MKDKETKPDDVQPGETQGTETEDVGTTDERTRVTEDVESDDPQEVERRKEADNNRVVQLNRSIRTHKQWIKKYEQELEALKRVADHVSYTDSEIGSKLLRQRSQIEMKLEEQMEIYAKHNMSTEGLYADLDSTNALVYQLAEEFAKLMAKMKEKPKETRAKEIPENRSVPSAGLNSRVNQEPLQSHGMQAGASNVGQNTTGSSGTANSQEQRSSSDQVSSEYARARAEFDPTGLFLPPPVFSGLSPTEQRSLERVHVETMKKLPNITLKQFSGKPHEDFSRWLFHFNQIIGSQTTLSKAGKLTFLLQALKGRALQRIESYTAMNFSEDCYDKCMEMLNTLYGGAVRENGKIMLKFQQSRPLGDLSASELSRVFINMCSLRDFHKEKGNTFCLENAASSDFRDARTKLGSYLSEFDLWLVRTQNPPCLNSLITWIQQLHDAAHMKVVIDGSDDYEDYEQSNAGQSGPNRNGNQSKGYQRGNWQKRSDTQRHDTEYSHRKNDSQQNKNSSRPVESRGAGTTNSKEKSDKTCSICGKSGHKVEQCFRAKKMNAVELRSACSEKKLCFRCLRPGHMVRLCRAGNEVKCTVRGCQRRHHWMLHDESRGNNHSQGSGRNKAPTKEKSHGAMDKEDAESLRSSDDEEHGTENRQNNNFKSKSQQGGRIGIQVITARVHCGKRSAVANILLDEGSNNSNISEDLAKKLEMKNVKGPVSRVITVMGGKRVKVSSNLVKFELSPIDPPKILKKHGVDEKTRFGMEAWTMSDVCGQSSLIDWNVKKKNFPHLKDLPIARIGKSEQIDVVLGTDVPGLLAVLESRVGPTIKCPIAHLTRVGWVIMGPSEKGKHTKGIETSALSFRAQEFDPDDGLDRLAQSVWDSEPLKTPLPTTFGLPDAAMELDARNRKFQSEVQQEAYDKMVVTYNDKGKFYTARIPWKGDGKPGLVSNRREVMKRQVSTFAPNYMKKKGVELADLLKIIKNYEAKGYIRELRPNEIADDSWYLPTFPVVDKSRTTTKIRLVFDAAFRHQGKSLNSETLTGPNLLLNFLAVLFRFRKFEFCLISDISEMFLQVRLDEDDQRYHRFLFMDENQEMKDYQWLRTVFGGNSIPNISQKVLHVLCEDHGESFPEAVETLKLSTYMDDSCDSRKTEEDVMRTVEELRKLLPLAGMCPRKWMSNSKKVLDQVPAEDRAKEVELIGDQLCLNDAKILGVRYSPEHDEFYLVGSESPGGKGSRRKIPLNKDGEIVWTKRLLLSLLFKQYDPLGFATPFTIRGKMLLQRIMSMNLSWDDQIPEHYKSLWKTWLKCLADLEKLRIKRHIGMGNENAKYSIHCFCDASIEAYACIFYLRVQCGNECDVSFLLSKARVTPMKAVSIARLELMAAQLGAETSIQVREYLGHNLPVYYYTDSVDVLFWINQPSKLFRMFISNRAGVIQSLTKVKNWFHVPSKQNAADIATRGMKVAELAECKLWWRGPEFLCGPDEEFPRRFNLDEHTVEKSTEDEFRPLLSFQGSQTHVDRVKMFLDPKKHSCGDLFDGWKTLRRKTAMLFVFHKNLSRDEKLQRAEVLLIRMAQAESYTDVIEALKEGKDIPKKHSLSRYAPYLDENGLLRSKSRLEHSDIMPKETRLPIILPSRSRITYLMCMSAHNHLQHAVGDNMLRGNLAKRFVIPSLYYVERKIKKDCVTCIKRNALAAKQMMAPLPDYRLTEPLHAFSRVGIDFAGPFHIKQKRETRAQALRPKHYVLVLTCLQTRAVHFEVTPALDTDAVLNALSRFCDRRGVPQLIVSDNATSFKAAEKVLVDQIEKIDEEKLKNETSSGYKLGSGIKWIFNPPTGSHFGGVYEIIVEALKRALHAVYGYADLQIDEFTTAVCNVEGLLNSRPLAEVKMQPEESEILTPNHFLNVPLGTLEESSDSTEGNLAKKWKYLQTLGAHYKKRFVNEIVATMHPRQKWHSPEKNLKEGDLVIELSESEPRLLWKIAKVVEILPGIDENVRKVKIKHKGGDNILIRPIHKLFPLEFGSFDRE
jgi:hypothetical protein